MKYALIESNVVIQISIPPKVGYEPVDDSVFAGFIRSGENEFTNPAPPKKHNPTAQLRELWDSAPAWIRGPYQHLRPAVLALAGRDPEALMELLNSVEPTTAIAADPVKLSEFNSALAAVKQVADDA